MLSNDCRSSRATRGWVDHQKCSCVLQTFERLQRSFEMLKRLFPVLDCNSNLQSQLHNEKKVRSSVQIVLFSSSAAMREGVAEILSTRRKNEEIAALSEKLEKMRLRASMAAVGFLLLFHLDRVGLVGLFAHDY